MGLLSSHHVFSSGDLDEGASFAGQVWERNQSIKTDRRRYGIRWNQFDMEKVGFSYIEHDCAVDLTAQGPLSDHFRIFFHEYGSINHTADGKRFESDVCNPVMHAPETDLHLDINPFGLLLLSVDGAGIRKAMRERYRKLKPFREWVGAMPQGPRLSALQSSVRWMAGEADRAGSPLATPGKSRIFAERLLLSLIVECLSEASPSDSEPVQDLSHAQVKRAEDWIDAHLTEAIGVDEVSSATGVGIRSLQMSFRRVHGCSPQQFIINRRLDEARRQLLTSPKSTVTSIATGLGFFELGRFSQRYRERFGETPSAARVKRFGPHTRVE
jgi:AraC-like DNA-binding protein